MGSNRRKSVTARRRHSIFREGLKKPTNLGTPDVRTKIVYLYSLRGCLEA